MKETVKDTWPRVRLCACGMQKRCVWEEVVVYEQHEEFVPKTWH